MLVTVERIIQVPTPPNEADVCDGSLTSVREEGLINSKKYDENSQNRSSQSSYIRKLETYLTLKGGALNLTQENICRNPETSPEQSDNNFHLPKILEILRPEDDLIMIVKLASSLNDIPSRDKAICATDPIIENIRYLLLISTASTIPNNPNNVSPYPPIKQSTTGVEDTTPALNKYLILGVDGFSSKGGRNYPTVKTESPKRFYIEPDEDEEEVEDYQTGGDGHCPTSGFTPADPDVGVIFKIGLVLPFEIGHTRVTLDGDGAVLIDSLYTEYLEEKDEFLSPTSHSIKSEPSNSAIKTESSVPLLTSPVGLMPVTSSNSNINCFSMPQQPIKHHYHHYFKPVSVQALWMTVQCLNKLLCCHHHNRNNGRPRPPLPNIRTQQCPPSPSPCISISYFQWVDHYKSLVDRNHHHRDSLAAREWHALAPTDESSSTKLYYDLASEHYCYFFHNSNPSYVANTTDTNRLDWHLKHTADTETATKLSSYQKGLIMDKLRDIMSNVDLEEITFHEIRQRLSVELIPAFIGNGSNNLNHQLNPSSNQSSPSSCSIFDSSEVKNFVEEQILVIMGQLDKATEICPEIYLGSEWNASNLDELRSNKIGYIVNVTKEVENFYPGYFNYQNIRVADDEHSDLLPHWDKTFKFINRAIRRARKIENSSLNDNLFPHPTIINNPLNYITANQTTLANRPPKSDLTATSQNKNHNNVLVHCKMGISRSASVVIAYLMKAQGMCYLEALNIVKSRRSCVKPNPNFEKQLQIYQGILNASNNRQILIWRSKSESYLQPFHVHKYHEVSLSSSEITCSPRPLILAGATAVVAPTRRSSRIKALLKAKVLEESEECDNFNNNNNNNSLLGVESKDGGINCYSASPPSKKFHSFREHSTTPRVSILAKLKRFGGGGGGTPINNISDLVYQDQSDGDESTTTTTTMTTSNLSIFKYVGGENANHLLSTEQQGAAILSASSPVTSRRKRSNETMTLSPPASYSSLKLFNHQPTTTTHYPYGGPGLRRIVSFYIPEPVSMDLKPLPEDPAEYLQQQDNIIITPDHFLFDGHDDKKVDIDKNTPIYDLSLDLNEIRGNTKALRQRFDSICCERGNGKMDSCDAKSCSLGGKKEGVAKTRNNPSFNYNFIKSKLVFLCNAIIQHHMNSVHKRQQRSKKVVKKKKNIIEQQNALMNRSNSSPTTTELFTKVQPKSFLPEKNRSSQSSVNEQELKTIPSKIAVDKSNLKLNLTPNTPSTFLPTQQNQKNLLTPTPPFVDVVDEYNKCYPIKANTAAAAATLLMKQTRKGLVRNKTQSYEKRLSVENNTCESSGISNYNNNNDTSPEILGKGKSFKTYMLSSHHHSAAAAAVKVHNSYPPSRNVVYRLSKNYETKTTTLTNRSSPTSTSPHERADNKCLEDIFISAGYEKVYRPGGHSKLGVRSKSMNIISHHQNCELDTNSKSTDNNNNNIKRLVNLPIINQSTIKPRIMKFCTETLKCNKGGGDTSSPLNNDVAEVKSQTSADKNLKNSLKHHQYFKLFQESVSSNYHNKNKHFMPQSSSAKLLKRSGHTFESKIKVNNKIFMLDQSKQIKADDDYKDDNLDNSNISSASSVKKANFNIRKLSSAASPSSTFYSRHQKHPIDTVTIST